MAHADPYRQFNFRVTIQSTGAAVQPADADVTALELLAPGGGNQQVGLLLPAVQKVRSAAAPANPRPGGPGSVTSNGIIAVLIGLLLPAVQKVREAARRSTIPNGPGTITAGGGSQQIGLLLPAVQKVREAASRNTSDSALMAAAKSGAKGAALFEFSNIGSFSTLKGISEKQVVEVKCHSRSGGGTVLLENAVVFDVIERQGTLQAIIGFGSARLG